MKRIAFLSLDFSNTFNEALLESVLDCVGSRDALVHCYHGGRLRSPEADERHRNALYDSINPAAYDGILVSNLFDFVSDEEAADFLARFAPLPVVTIAKKLNGIPGVTADNASGMRRLAEHLVHEAGCSSFGIIAGPENNPDSSIRLHAFTEYVTAAGCTVDAVIPGTFSYEDGIRGVRLLRERSHTRPDAIVCINDNMALGALAELSRGDIAVPSDIRLSGFDDTVESRCTSPALTTVRYPLSDMGRTAAAILLDMIAGNTVPEHTVLETSCIPRESTMHRSAVRHGTVTGTPRDSEITPDAASLLNAGIHERKRNERLYRFGEMIATAYSRESIVAVLDMHFGEFGTEFIAVMEYHGARTELRPLCILPESEPHCEDTVPAGALLPEGCAEYHGMLIIEPLHVNEDHLGIMVLKPTRGNGLICKILRHQISAALKSTLLLETINAYSHRMEQLVAERTRELERIAAFLREEITRREEAERALVRNRNIESLGILAGGIAHDFNNYLTGISGNVSLLKEHALSEADRIACIASIETVLADAAALTRQLLTFASGGAPVKTRVSLEEHLRHTLRFMLRGSRITAHIESRNTIPPLLLDEGQISQVFHNLIINAIQAMGDTGSIDITLDRLPVAVSAESDSDTAVITITDSGPGIDPAVIDRIFDPYFTTKAEGSGLGLAVSLQIIRRHGGDIHVESSPGRTSFIIRIPIIPADRPEPAAAPPPRMSTGALRGRRILVLEDEPSIGMLLERMASVKGMACVVTTEGSETISRFSGNHESYDALLLDLTVPEGLGGAEVIRAVREMNTTVPAVVMSGYSDLPVISHYREYGFNAVLRKPFTMNDLETVLAGLWLTSEK